MGRTRALPTPEILLVDGILEELLADPATPPRWRRGRPRWESTRENQQTFLVRETLYRLRDLRAHGDPADRDLADRALDVMAWTGLERRAFVVPRREQSHISQDGQVLAVNARIGVRTRDAAGRANGHRQLTFWWDATPEQFLEWLADRRVQARGHELLVARMEGVAVVLERYPTARTVGEACLLAGVDPRAIDLDDLLSP